MIFSLIYDIFNPLAFRPRIHQKDFLFADSRLKNLFEGFSLFLALKMPLWLDSSRENCWRSRAWRWSVGRCEWSGSAEHHWPNDSLATHESKKNLKTLLCLHIYVFSIFSLLTQHINNLRFFQHKDRTPSVEIDQRSRRQEDFSFINFMSRASGKIK